MTRSLGSRRRRAAPCRPVSTAPETQAAGLVPARVRSLASSVDQAESNKDRVHLSTGVVHRQSSSPDTLSGAQVAHGLVAPEKIKQGPQGLATCGLKFRITRKR